MAKTKKAISNSDFVITPEWIRYLLFLSVLALLYIYLSHRTDNMVRDIDRAKRNLIELRAENITLKSELIQNRSRQSLEERLADKKITEPNRAVKQIPNPNDER